MLRNAYTRILLQFLGATICSSGVLAANCTSVIITSLADAEALRQNCPVVNGTVGIGLFNETTTQHINLDGVEVIQGNLQSVENVFNTDDITSTPYTISSSTLRLVEGSIELFQDSLQNLTLPNLTTVYGSFYIMESPITYLDITSLESADSFVLGGNNLTTLHHTKLTNTTAIELYEMSVDSVDSILSNPLDIISCHIEGPFPNMESITLGFTNVSQEVRIYASLNVTLGGSSATKLHVESLILDGNSTGLTRSPTLESLTANSMVVTNTFMSRLDVDFDDLQSLESHSPKYYYLEEIRLPPQAVNWTGGFELYVTANPKLNFTSQYTIDDAGNQVRTWYWPTNVSRIEILWPLIGNGFLHDDTFLTQEMQPLNSTPAPSILNDFSITPNNNSVFNCTPFDTLHQMGRLNGSYSCFSELPSAAPAILVPSLMAVISVLFGLTMVSTF
ncbi:uncharacterized protein N7483_007294 [Penicillium malachiteum]|uniref:uncharacterized protein n=1 Tax=Penicillium malachiteum TaxID=1324776 RepID=UPI002548BD13|nr:uncharacterized protein N7483_007294 [Penicillium malachiteum]KAJ5725937.1 hypothetical protein N7483_007294 [Penicillium malachiteum]